MKTKKKYDISDIKVKDKFILKRPRWNILIKVEDIGQRFVVFSLLHTPNYFLVQTKEKFLEKIVTKLADKERR